MAKQLTFYLTPQEFAARKQKIAALGMAVPEGDSGRLSKDTALGQVVVAYSYNGRDSVTVVIEKSPPFSGGAVVKAITGWFTESA